MLVLKLPSKQTRKVVFHKAFVIGMFFRIVYGILRLILGLALLKVIGTPVADVFYSFMSHELITDPKDIIINTIYPLLEHSSFTVTYFLAMYLIFWGVIDAFLSTFLLKGKSWAFPFSMYLIGAFILYEIYRFTYTHSITLLFVILIDCIILWLINRESKKLHHAETIKEDYTKLQIHKIGESI